MSTAELVAVGGLTATMLALLVNVTLGSRTGFANEMRLLLDAEREAHDRTREENARLRDQVVALKARLREVGGK